MLGCVSLVLGCSDEGGGNTGGGGSTSVTSNGGAGGTASCEVPTRSAELAAYISAETYTTFNAESAAHDSAGPHFGNVRTFINDVLFDSLETGNAEHPVCSASVKELYGDDDTLGGHTVAVKVANGSGGDAWYWYELYEGSDFADGTGVSLCTGCHSGGTDFVLTPFPLQ